MFRLVCMRTAHSEGNAERLKSQPHPQQGIHQGRPGIALRRYGTGPGTRHRARPVDKKAPTQVPPQIPQGPHSPYGDAAWHTAKSKA